MYAARREKAGWSASLDGSASRAGGGQHWGHRSFRAGASIKHSEQSDLEITGRSEAGGALTPALCRRRQNSCASSIAPSPAAQLACARLHEIDEQCTCIACMACPRRHHRLACRRDPRCGFQCCGQAGRRHRSAAIDRHSAVQAATSAVHAASSQVAAAPAARDPKSHQYQDHSWGCRKRKAKLMSRRMCLQVSAREQRPRAQQEARQKAGEPLESPRYRESAAICNCGKAMCSQQPAGRAAPLSTCQRGTAHLAFGRPAY